MTALVTGATGTVGRQVVAQLHEAGVPVRALTRDPDRAVLPPGVDVARGDLTDPSTLTDALDGATALHLITFGGDGAPLECGPELVDRAVRAGVERVSVLGGWDESSVEPALRASPVGWTLLEPVEFMSGALEWADQVRDDSTVRLCGDHPSAVVHEADIAAVAVAALTRDGHAGRTYRVTGPEPLTVTRRVRILSEALGRPVEFVELTAEQERERLHALGYSDEYAEFGVSLATTPPADAGHISPVVRDVTGRPARTFDDWARENASAFR